MAAVVFVLEVLALMFLDFFSAQWYVGLLFVIISVVYFIAAVFLKKQTEHVTKSEIQHEIRTKKI